MMNTGGGISLAERLAELPWKGGAGPLRHETLACVMSGAALATGQDYFKWRLDRLDQVWSTGPNYPYGVAVGFARSQIRKCMDDPDDLSLYYQLLIQLTIEPFDSLHTEQGHRKQFKK